MMGLSTCFTAQAQTAAPVWHTDGQKTASGSGTSLSVARPDNISAGDLILLIFTQQRSASSSAVGFSTPADFTLIRSEHNTGNNAVPQVVAFYKIASGNEPLNYTSTVTNWGSTPNWKAVAARVTGSNPFHPIGNHSGTNSNTSSVTSLALPSLNTTSTNSLLVGAVTVRRAISDETLPTSMTDLFYLPGSGSSDHNNNQPAFGGAFQNIASAGATGTKTISWSGSARAAGLMFAINPVNPANCPNNLLVNPGFESGLLSWGYWGTVATNTDARSGSLSAHITGGSSGLTQAIQGTSGQAYTATVWVKAQNIIWGNITIEFFNSNWQLISVTPSVSFGNSSSYTAYTVSGTAPAGTAIVQVVAGGGINAGGYLRLDDFCLTTPPFAPGGVAGAAMWLKADQGVTTGSTLTWADLSGNNRNGVQPTSAYQPAITANGINFNPAFTFDGANDFLSVQNLAGLPTGSSQVHQFAVGRHFNAADSWGRFFSYGAESAGQMFQLSKNAGNANAAASVFGTEAISSSLEFSNGTPVLLDGKYTGTQLVLSSFGVQRAATTVASNRTTAGGAIGSNFTGTGSLWNGHIPEIIVYPTNLTAAQASRVNSYLALKYGITIDQSIARNYMASDGTTIFWTGTTNSGHKNNIAGIARDDASSLNQKQSRSVNSGLQVVIGNGNTIAATNAANNQNFAADKSALVWGDNGGSVAAWTITGAPSNRVILPRTWKVQETGTVGSVKIQVPDNSAPNGLPSASGPVYLLVDADGNFASGATTHTMTLNGANWEVNVDLANGQFFTFANCSNQLGTPVFSLGAASNRCQGAGSASYTATAANHTGLSYSLDAASIAAGNSINASTGAVTYLANYTGTSTITVTTQGCGGPLTATHTVTVLSNLGALSFTGGATSIRCQGGGTVTYTATAANNTGISYSLDAASLDGGCTIHSSTGIVNYSAGWSGTTSITATATGCGGPISATHTVTVRPLISMPNFVLGGASTRCQAAGNVTYTATAANATSYSYSLDAVSLAAGNSINAGNGQVTYVAGWSGTSIVTVMADGCGGPLEANHTVTVVPTVGKPVFDESITSFRCTGAEDVTYAVTAINNNGISYSLDAASLSAGNTIDPATGIVTYVADWNGISTITATATGCNGPTSSAITVQSALVVAMDDVVEGTQGKPLVINLVENDLCAYDLNSITFVSPPQFGNLQFSTDGKVIYLPAGNFAGNDEFVYQICSLSDPSICDQATVSITILASYLDPCAEATRNKTYYLPFEENSTLRGALLSAGTLNLHSNIVRSVVSVKIPYPGITITYDHWEDGYETDITAPVQPTTQVWGDGNIANGAAPGYPDDILPPGAYIVLDNQFQYNPRNPSEIVYDGKDKIFTRGDVAISKVTGDAGFGGGSVIFDVQNFKTNVYDINRYGEYFVMPFGENISLGGTVAFRYTGIFIKAAENGTIINFDYNGDGIVDITQTLNEGQSWFYDGTASQPGVFPADVNNANDIKAGATVTANKPVGVDLVFGDGFNYGTRNLALLPSLFYASSYYTPVYTTTPSNANIQLNPPVYVFFTNILDKPITVQWTSNAGSGTVSVPANGSNYYAIPYSATGRGYRFHTIGGEPFTAVSVIDADADGSRYDWAFNLIPEERLTTFSSIAWAPGSRNGSGNYHPIWVTPTANTTIYAKFDGNMTGTSATLSPCGLPYDIAVPVNYLESYRFFDYTDNDQSGMALFTCDETTFTAVWGQDSRANGAETPPGSPAMDVGYVLEPKCLDALIFANNDYRFTAPETPITIVVTENDFGFLTTLNPLSVHTDGLLQPENGTIVNNSDGTITYTPNPGFEGVDKFEYLVCAVEYPTLCDIATVRIRVTECPAISTENIITGVVFVEQLPDDGMYNGEGPAWGVKVDLYADLNCSGSIDAGEGIIQSTISDPSGNYHFAVSNGFNAKDNFDPVAALNGNDGGINWNSNWVEQNDDGNINSGHVRVMPDNSPGGLGNAVRLSGNATSTLRGISRALIFNGATGAVLKFKYRREGLNNQGEALEVLVNGNVVLIFDDGDYVGTDLNYHEVIYPLASFNANGSNSVLFRVNSSVNADDFYWIDDVELVYFRNPACYVIQVDPSNTGGAFTPSTLNQQTAVFTGLGACETNNHFGVLVNLIAANDEVNTSVDVPVLIYVLANDVIGTPDPASVTTSGMVNQPQHGTVTLNPDGTITYTPNPGFMGTDDFEYQVCSLYDPNVCDIALVNVTVSCFPVALQNTVMGVVFDDINLNGTMDAGEGGHAGVPVNLFHDTNANGVLNAGEPLVATETSSSLGDYVFNIVPPSTTATYLDQFNTNGSASGSNGSTDWSSSPWSEINESNGFSTANVFVTGNQLRIQGSNTFYLDRFDVNTTANQSHGTTSWTGQSWVEIGESNGFSTTQITITATNGLRIAGNGTATVLGARRTVPLAGAGAAKLAFKATTFSLDINTWVDVQVASSTAGPWTTLTTIQGPSNAVVNNYNLNIPSDLLSATTTIRFVSNGLALMGSTRGVFFDDVQIRYVPSNRFIGATRTANLSTAVSATLSLDFAESGLDLEIDDYVDLLISKTPSGPWTLLKRFTGGDGNQNGAFSTNISNYISASTTIRLITSGSVDMTSSNIVNFDNVRFSYQVPLPASYIVQLAQPIPSGFGLTTPLPSPTGIQTASFTGMGAGNCQNNFGLAGADLALSKAVSSDTVLAGQTITYTIHVTNNGPANAASVSVADNLPAYLGLVSAVPDMGYWSAPNWVIGDLPVGGSATLVLEATVLVNVPSGTNITNTGTVSSTTPDPDPMNNSDAATSHVVCPDLTVTAVSNSPVCVSASIELSESGGNTGTWSWSGPAGYSASVQNPVIGSASLAQSGTYSVTFTTPNGCSDTASVNVVVNPLPVADLTKTSDLVCGVENVILIATPEQDVAYQWSAGAVPGEDNTAVVLDPGIFTVTVTDENGCTDVGTVMVEYIECFEDCNNGIDDDGDGLIDCDDPDCEMPIVQDFSFLNPTNCPVLNNGEITLLPEDSGYEYSVNGGNQYQTSNHFTGLVPGNYYVRVRNSSSGCHFDHPGNPVVLTGATCIEICDNGIDDDGDGLTDCADPDCTPLAVAGSGATICYGDVFDISISATGGQTPYTFTWDNGLGGGDSHAVSPLETTVYYVTVSSPAGCSSMDSVEVTVVFCPEDCTDGIDNDGDGLVDCDDPDCSIVGKPVAAPDTYQTCPGAEFQEQVIFNDYNLKNPEYSLYSLPGNGTVSMSPNGVFSYSPSGVNCSPDVFVYQVCNPEYGCCDTASVTLLFNDSQPPVLQNVPPDLTIGCDELVPATPLVYGLDSCPGIFLTFTENSTKEGAGSCQAYTITRTWQAADLCGNASSAEQVIQVEDITYPEIFRLYTLPNGKKLVAGVSKNTSHRWKSVRFPVNFATKPIVLTQVVTRNDTSAVTVRKRNVTIEGFEMRLQEEEAADGIHGYEEVAWFAIEPGFILDNDTRMFAGLFTNANNVQKTLNFSNAFSGTPAFLADMQTTKDADPAAVRINNLTATSVRLFIQEERSKDGEMVHGNEDVGYLAIMPGLLRDEEHGFVAEVDLITISSNWTTVNLQNSYTKPVVVFGGLANGGDPALVRVRNVTSNSFEVRIEEWDYLDGIHTNRSVSYIVTEGGIPAFNEFHCELQATGNLQPGVNFFVRDNCDNQVDMQYGESESLEQGGLMIDRWWSAVDDCGNVFFHARTDTCSVAKVRLKAFLNGAWIGSTSGSLMRDDLRVRGLIPHLEPYTGMTGFLHIGQGGGETLSPDLLQVTGPDAIVDWVFLEIRDPLQPADVLVTRSALIQRDGGIIMPDGNPVWGLPFLAEGYYHVAVRHRNHLGLMTVAPVYLDNSAPLLDFRDASMPVQGGLSGGKIINYDSRALWSGDLNGDRRVISQGPENDVFFLFSHVMSDDGNYNFLSNFLSNGYYRTDLNMDGTAIYQGPNNDRSLLLFNTVLGHIDNPYNLANFIVVEKLP